jgi:hypothetical protein
MSNHTGDWDCGWDGHTRAQRRRLATLPFADKLDWLEEADRLVRHLQEGRKRKPAGHAAVVERSHHDEDDR